MSYESDVQEYAGKGDDTRECEAMRKMFVGGLSRNTEEEAFLHHFEQYGEVVDKVIITDSYTKESRGFGFVTYATSDSVQNAFKGRPHNLDGKQLDVKRAMPREYNTAGAHAKTKKLFVGGFKGSNITEDDLQAYIESRHPLEYGRIEKIDLLKDPSGQNKGFGFMECSDNDFADRLAISENSFKLKGKNLAIKKAEPREGQGGPPSRGGGGRGRGAPRGGGSRGGGRGGYDGGYGGSRGGYDNSSSNQNYSTSYPTQTYGGGGGGYDSYGSGQSDRYSQAGSGGYSQGRGGYGQSSGVGSGYGQSSYGSQRGGYSQNQGSYNQSQGGYGQSRGGGRGGGPARGGRGGGGGQRYQPY